MGERSRLVIFALGTFHAAGLIATLVLILYALDGLAPVLGSLSTIAGLALFGALWVTQAALPILRAQGGGHILQVSSIGGISAFANIGMYHASKWALEGLSERDRILHR